jgi:four helix bundle protein
MEKSRHNYENLIVWQQALGLAKEIYAVTRLFPHEELYGLVSQLRRAAFSIPLNIAEGHGRGSKKEFIQFLLIARGSAYELDTALLLAKDLHYLNSDKYHELSDKTKEISRLLNGLIGSLKR